MNDSDKNDKSLVDQATDFVKDHPLAVGGGAIGSIGGISGIAIGTAVGAAADEAVNRWQSRSDEQDDS